MTDVKTKSVGGEDTPLSVLDAIPADANILLEGGRLVWSRIDTGYGVNSTYAAANPSNVRCWGRCDEHTDNTTNNGFGNSGLAGGVRIRFARGVFLLTGDGSLTQASLYAPVFLVSDVTSSNSGYVYVSASSFGGTRPYVGYVSTNPRGATDNPDASKIPVAIGLAAPLIPGANVQQYQPDTTVHTGAFNVVPGVRHLINPSGATFAYTFPAITAAIDGLHLSVVNVSTGSTATVAAPNGSNNIGNSAGTSTGATAAGPTGGATKVYTAAYDLGAWLVGI